MTSAIREIDIRGLPLYRRGKVRDTWDLGDRLLMVATDRISAFDVVLPQAIPDKGRVLTRLSSWWFAQTAAIVPNHLISTDLADLPVQAAAYRDVLRDRFMIVRKAERFDVECVVRGYLAGSAWVEYRSAGTVCGQPLPAGIVESEKLPEPIFTPAIKADTGHDENIPIAEMMRIVGEETARRLIDASLALYRYAEQRARTNGIIVADTKFEFGLIDGRLTVIDELLTPDSSRFWDVEIYEPGRPQDSFDKQPVRDWLTASGWDRNPPAPDLPPEVVEQTRARYRTAYERITGMEF